MATETEEADDGPAKSTLYVAVVRLSFITAGFVLAALYVESTHGQIRFSNLYYPYFVIGSLFVIGLTIYLEEIDELRGRSGDLDTIESIGAAIDEWRRSIGLVIAGVAYLYLIELLGFFVSSALGMIAIMLIGGLRDAKQIALVTALVLALIYLLFIRLMGLQPPQGVVGAW